MHLQVLPHGRLQSRVGDATPICADETSTTRAKALSIGQFSRWGYIFPNGGARPPAVSKRILPSLLAH